MRIPWAYLGGGLVTAMPADICGNECDFVERCNGDAVETCGGVDQCIGRHPALETCEAPNGTCAETDGFARCVRAPATRCASTFVNHCEGALLVVCSNGYLLASDCALSGQACVAGDGAAARCAAP